MEINGRLVCMDGDVVADDGIAAGENDVDFVVGMPVQERLLIAGGDAFLHVDLGAEGFPHKIIQYDFLPAHNVSRFLIQILPVFTVSL